MAAPAFWKGYLKLSLVTCQISMTPATTEGEKVKFHTINRKTGRRVRSRYIDAETEKPVDDEDQVKGYETSSDQFVTFEDEELESVALESVRTIDIDQFAPADSVPWIFYDSPYYVTPNDKVGEEAYAVIRDAMAEKGVVGISRVVLFRRERAVMVQPRDNGIILWTLRYGDEVREPDGYFKDIDKGKSDPKLLNLVSQLIDDRATSWDASMVHDPVQEQLKDLIAKRREKQGKTSKPRAAEKVEGPAGDNVVDLMSALKKSLEKPSPKPHSGKK
ncbi:Ku protein [Shinella sp.]|uniref:non-homologous end joining protein Ku n=1 Tax=Shinella sp. TaxID=1870904 RepID=UPI003F72CA51